MTAQDRILELVNKALDELDSPEVALSTVVRKAIRIARLRNDYDNLWWLGLEMIFFNDSEIRKLHDEIICHYTKERFEVLRKMYTESYINERESLSLDERNRIINKGGMLSTSVDDIEVTTNQLEMIVKAISTPQGLHPLDLYRKEEANAACRDKMFTLIQNRRSILARIKHRVYDFLSKTERQLVFGQINADIFDKNRQFVDTRLVQICPEAVEMFAAVYKRLGEGDKEARSQALGSCRRILKEIADALYPASSTPVMGKDGKQRILTDDKYIARLWQFAADRLKGSSSGKVFLTTLDDIGGRIDSLYSLSCKGVHAEISESELNQCVIQTYLLIGDLLRLHDGDSAMTGDN